MGIYILRHAVSENNLLKKISGRYEVDIISGQSIEGKYKDAFFDKAYCSESKRCIDTIKLMRENSIKEAIYTPILLERNMGLLENMGKKEAISNYPEYFVDGRIAVSAEIPDGETIYDVRQRVNELVKDIISESKDKNILICSHNQTLKVIYALIKNIEITDEYWRNVDFPNAEIVLVDLEQ